MAALRLQQAKFETQKSLEQAKLLELKEQQDRLDAERIAIEEQSAQYRSLHEAATNRADAVAFAQFYLGNPLRDIRDGLVTNQSLVDLQILISGHFNTYINNLVSQEVSDKLLCRRLLDGNHNSLNVLTLIVLAQLQNLLLTLSIFPSLQTSFCRPYDKGKLSFSLKSGVSMKNKWLFWLWLQLNVLSTVEKSNEWMDLSKWFYDINFHDRKKTLIAFNHVFIERRFISAHGCNIFPIKQCHIVLLAKFKCTVPLVKYYRKLNTPGWL